MPNDKIFSWGYKDIAPINAIHRARNKYPSLKLYRVRDSLIMVLAKGPKDAAKKLNALYDDDDGWAARHFKLYRDA